MGSYIGEVRAEMERKMNPSQERYIEKRNAVFRCLILHRFTDEKGVGEALEMTHYKSGSPANHYPFIKKLMTQKLIVGFNKAGINQRLYMLTKKGRVFAENWLPKAGALISRLPTSEEKIKAVRAPHDLEFQHFANQVIGDLKKRGEYKGLATSTHSKNRSLNRVWGINPDGLLLFEIDGENIAISIEYERTHKKPKDRLWLFKRYEQAILEKQIDHVIFGFNKGSVKKLYENDFNRTDKPMLIGKRNKHTKKIKVVETRMASHGIFNEPTIKEIMLSKTPKSIPPYFHFMMVGEDTPKLKAPLPYYGGIVSLSRRGVFKKGDWSKEKLKNPVPISGLSEEKIKELKRFISFS